MQAQLRASHISLSLAMKFQGACSLRYRHWFGGRLIVEPLWVDSFWYSAGWLHGVTGIYLDPAQNGRQ
jgi:hypothetical protein